MLALIVHAVLAIVTVIVIISLNRVIFARTVGVSALEVVYYIVGIASVVLGWYFNVSYVLGFTHAFITNPFWGTPSWTSYIQAMFANDAVRSASQDYTLANVVIFPIWSIIDGRRRGIKQAWLFFLASLFSSFVFALAFYLATAERARRRERAAAAAAADPAPATV